MVRLRIAPSPTGYPHIGTIYQALFNYAFAKKHNGKFIVRIEDTDRARFVEGSEDVIFSSLDWFGLTEDESARKGGDSGPYRQSERLEIYHKYAQELVTRGFAYFSYYASSDAGKKKEYTKDAQNEVSFHTDEEPPKTIEEMLARENWVLRMKKVLDSDTLTVKDEIRGQIVFHKDQITDQVLLKSDGYPTYHLAVVIDDHLMGISHIVRAEEWISSLPKHVLLYNYFGWHIPPIYHTATLRNPDKSKLSKRHGHTNVLWFKEEGYLPEAVLNFLALLGWSHPEEKEIFTLSEFVQLFDLKDIRPVAPIFDVTKLQWMNQQYIQMKEDQELKKLIMDFYKDSTTISDEVFDKLIPLLKSRMVTLKDFEHLTAIFLGKVQEIDYSDDEKTIAKELKEGFQGLNEWQKDNIFQVMKPLLEKHKVRMNLFYKILTGLDRGLPLPETLDILGKEKALSRLDEVINNG